MLPNNNKIISDAKSWLFWGYVEVAEEYNGEEGKFISYYTEKLLLV